MLHISERMRRELRQTPDDLISIEARLAVPIHEDDIYSLLDHFEEAPWTPKADEVGWELFQRDKESGCGEDQFHQLLFIAGDEHIRRLAESDARETHVAERFARFDRDRLPSDRLIIDLMDDARFQGWTPPPHIDAALALLEAIADESRADLEATHTLSTTAELLPAARALRDAAQAEWLAFNGKATAEQVASWNNKYSRVWVPYTEKLNPVVIIPTPVGPGGIPLLGNQAVTVELGQPILDGFISSRDGKAADVAPMLPASMREHPLHDRLNIAIGHAVALAERSHGAVATTVVADVLAVLHMVHAETYRTAIARLRALGCSLPEGRLNTAITRFEIAVMREVRSGAGWRTNAKGEPDPQNADNVSVFLRLVGVELRFNVWRQRVEVRHQNCDWLSFTDAELNRLRSTASTEEYRLRPTKDFFRDMLTDIARQTSYDPVLDLIDAAEWDGVARLPTWLSRACGVECSPYHQAVGRNVIGGIVKRARQPGCKHDEVMILIGKQGCGKSELTKLLSLNPEWHTDSVTFDGRPQDIIPQMFGRLVIEMSELDGVHRRDVGYIKRFLSTQTDNYTAKYDALATDNARRCIFIGTCNLENPLVDDTGNRRFYPVRIPDGVEIDLDWLRENIGQLIAEAAHMEAAGDAFRIPKEVWASAAVAQDAARSVSAVEELVLQWFSKALAPGVAGFYILSGDLVNALTMARQNSNAKVGRVMEKLGYVQKRPYVNGVQVRAWVRSPDGEIGNCVQLGPVQALGGAVEMRMKARVL